MQAGGGVTFERTHVGSDAVEGCWHELAKERERFVFDESKLYFTVIMEKKQQQSDHRVAQFAEQQQLASWFSGRGRILAQCDAKFTAARATFGGGVFAAGMKPGHVQRAIASIRVGRVECLCLGGAATDTAAERTRAGVGWEARVRKVDAFAAIALIEGEGGGDGDRSAGEMKIEPTVALFKMLCEAKMAGVAWEGVEEHVLRSMRGGEGRDLDAVEVGYVHLLLVRRQPQHRPAAVVVVPTQIIYQRWQQRVEKVRVRPATDVAVRQALPAHGHIVVEPAHPKLPAAVNLCLVFSRLFRLSYAQV